MDLEKLRDHFFNPADEFSPIPFWFWNDNLTRPEIIRQIRDFKEKGVMGFIIHPRIGIPKEIEYLSDFFLELVTCAVEEAEKLGMQVMLYDEGMYPSGSAHGMVVKYNPSFASRGLKMVEYPVDGCIEIPVEFEDEAERLVSIQAVKKIDNKSIDPMSQQKLEIESGKVCFKAPDADNWSVLLFIETYSHGTIRGIHFDEDDGQPGAPPSADLLNPDAVKAFINFTHERYYQVLERHFGKTIIAMFTDEPSILGRRARRGLVPWTNDFLHWYLDCGCTELDLAALWFDLGETTAIKRKQFKQAVNKKLEHSYYAQISKWCLDHNIALTGHPEASDEIGLLKYFHIPGQDVVWRWVAPEKDLAITGPHSTMAKCSSDAARHLKRRRNSNECFACCGANRIEWSFNVSDMKWYMDWLFVRGVNLLYPHAFFYSVEGEGRYNERPPDVGPNNIWWPYYRIISDYMKRMSWLMTDSVNQAKIAVLCEPDCLPWQITRPLYEHQFEFNYLENTLFESEVKIAAGKILIAAQEYSVLVVEDVNHLTEAVISKLRLFTAQGGKVFIYNPTQAALKLESVCEITDFAHIVPAVSRVLNADLILEPSNPNLRVSHVIKDDIHFYLLTNEQDQVIQGQAGVSEIGYTELWDAWNGNIKEPEVVSINGDSMQFKVKLHPRESMIIAVDPKQRPVVKVPEKQASILRTVELNKGWQIQNPPVNMETADELESWTDFPEMENFSGTLTYTNKFELKALSTGNSIQLDLGEVCELARVFVNEREVGVKLMAPYTFDLTEYVKEGNNIIAVDVTNTLANKYTNAQLKSGLIGPVKVVVKTFR